MIRNLLPWTAGCLLAAFAVSSCESDDVDYGPISAAIEIGVEEVTPSSAKIRLTTEQENVASYKIVKPTPISEFEYAAHDAIDRLAFIEERGEAAGAPFEQTLAGLMPKVEYSFAVVGLDASGQRITAPTFARFTRRWSKPASRRIPTRPSPLRAKSRRMLTRSPTAIFSTATTTKPPRPSSGRCSKPAAAA